MQKTLAVLLILFVTVLLGVHPAEASPPTLDAVRQRLASGEPTRIACFGDSITGVYYHTGGRRAWCDMLGLALRRAYPDAQVEMVNAGVSGNTTAQGLARMDKDVIAKQPHLVVVMFGMNDVARLPDEEQFAANMARIVDRCHAAGAAVILCTPNAVDENEPRPNHKLDAYSAHIRRLAAERDLPLIDFFAEFQALRAGDELAWALLMSDAIHPNMRGHRLFAERMAETIAGQEVSLDDVPPTADLLDHTRRQLAAGKPIRLVAMPPYDELMPVALRRVYPAAQIDVTTWPTEGLSVREMSNWAVGFRELKPDLVVTAATDAAAEGEVGYVRGYGSLLNLALRFGRDTVPVLLASDATEARLALTARIVQGKDLQAVTRGEGEARPAADLLAAWVAAQLESE